MKFIQNNKKNIIILSLIAVLGTGFGYGAGLKAYSSAMSLKLAAAQAEATKPCPAKTSQTNTEKINTNLPYTDALTIVANPTKYLNKKVRIKAKFDKFSVLGLDYKPAMRSSEDYITFLIKRDDVINNVVPLSEMKNFLKRKTPEKYIDLKPGDLVEYTGTVFSDALSDTWIDVESFKVLKSESLNKQKASTSSK